MHSESHNTPQRRTGLVLAAAIGCLSLAPLARSQTAPSPAAVLFDAGAAEAERSTAADALLSGRRHDLLVDTLDRAAAPVAARLVIDRLLANGAPLDDGAVRVLAAAARHAPVEDARRAIVALGELQSKAAVRGTMRLYQGEAPAPLRAASLRSLVRQTGMSQLGDDREAWAAWWEEVEWLPEPEWRARLASAHSARARRLSQQRDALAARLAETYRRLHAALGPEDRSGLVAELIGDERAELRLLGLDLAHRAMLNARPLAEASLSAALERMGDADERVRTQAAIVVARAAPPQAGGAAGAALMNETHAPAAAAQLGILARFPDRLAASPALRWLDDGGQASQAAADALAAMARGGMLDAPAQRLEALRIARSIDPEGWSGAHARLLDAVGEGDDLDRLAQAGLPSDSAEVRAAAASALARRSGYAEALGEALGEDPSLLGVIAQGLGARLAPGAALAELRRIAREADVQDALEEHEHALIALMPPREALDAIATIEAPTRRESLLERLTSRDEAPDAAHLALALARLELGDGVGAVEATDPVDDPTTPEARRALVLALAWTNDLDRAAALETPAQVWLEAFDRCREAALPHAPAVAARALSIHGDSLGDEDRARLEAASENIAPAATAEGSAQSPKDSGDASVRQ